jgi:hypothetical protein
MVPPLGSIMGVGELTPQRNTTGVTGLGQTARAAALALTDAGLDPDAIDGLLITPQPGETPEHAPITVAEYLGLSPHMANIVDLGRDVVESILLGDFARCMADDERKLSFIVELGRGGRPYGCAFVAHLRVGESGADRWHTDVRPTAFVSMRLVVHPDTEDLGGDGDRWEQRDVRNRLRCG